MRTKDLPQRDRMPVPAVKGSFENPYSTGRAPYTMHERRLIDWENDDAACSSGASREAPQDRRDPPETPDPPETREPPDPPEPEEYLRPEQAAEPAASAKDLAANPETDAAPVAADDDRLSAPRADQTSLQSKADGSTQTLADGPETPGLPPGPNYHPVPEDGSVPHFDGPQTPKSQSAPRIHFAIGAEAQSVLTERSPFQRNLSAIAVLIRKGLWFVLASAGVWLATMFMLIVVFGFFNPPLTALMFIRMAGGQTIDQRWVPIEGISPNLVRAVISSEDSRFCSHWGIDTDEIEAAIRRARDGLPRGASTMTMQLAKNLFLWPDKSYVRKALEAPLTLMIEAVWSKRRIAEVYLNVVEWGPGIFGAQAAARRHFQKPASALTAAQAAALAVSLPNPIARQPSRHGPRLQAMSRTVQARMRAMGNGASCVLGR